MAKTRDGDTEGRILDAAHAVFMRHGTAGARMQEIAAEAGVNQALLHYYFRSKQQLAAAVFRSVATKLLPPVIEVLSSDAPVEAKVERVIALELEHLSRSPYLPGYVISELNQHPERVPQLVQAMTGAAPDHVGTRVIEVLERQLGERAREGTMRKISARQFVVNLLSLCLFPFAARVMVGAMLRLDEPGFAEFIEERRRELPAFFLDALRP